MMNPWKIITSVLSALFGVRPAQGAQEDFAEGKLWPYILVGLVFILLFIALLVMVVHLVLQ